MMRFLCFCGFITINLLAGEASASVNCVKFPTFCAANQILSGQPNIDSELGLRTQEALAAIERTIARDKLDIFLTLVKEQREAIQGRVRDSQAEVAAILDEANSGGALRSVIGFLKTVATVAKIAHEVQEYVAEVSKSDNTGDAENLVQVDAAENVEQVPFAATPGYETFFGRLSQEKLLSDEGKARVEALVTANAGGRYFTVMNIIDRLDYLGEPRLPSDFGFPIEHELLLAKGYSIVAGIEMSEADKVFEDFEFSSDALGGFIENFKNVNPVSLFADIIFTSRPVGDGTVFSKNAVPSLLHDLDRHAQKIMEWRSGGTVVDVPWRSGE